MTFEIGVVLFVFLLFVALILSGKVKIHVAALVIPIVLEITGVLKFNQAWAGLSNSSVIMMASMFVVGAGIAKTSLVARVSNALIKPGSSDIKIMAGIAIPIILLDCFVNATATMTIMIPMITGICAEQKRPLSKFMYPACVLAQLWSGAIPTGGNAGAYLSYNTIIENPGGTGTYTYFTDFITKIPALLLVTPALILLTVKMTPDNGNIPTAEEASTAAGKLEQEKKKRASKLSPEKEKLCIAIFILTILGIIFCAIAKKSTWWPSLIGAMAMVLTGILSDRDAIKSICNPVIFITVGTLPLSTALKTTGADVLLADLFNKATGGLPPVAVMVAMYLVCFFLTQFITNSAVSNSFRTLAALICVQNGYDARALMLAVGQGSGNCYMTPMASPAMTMGYESGGYTMKQFFKTSWPIVLLRFFCFVLYVPFVFPLV